MKPLIYIAGPFSAPHEDQVDINIDTAEVFARCLIQRDIHCVCPHSLGRNFKSTGSYKYWIDVTMRLLETCDAVLLLPGWKDSPGTLGEIAAAEDLGLPVFTTLSDVIDFDRHWSKIEGAHACSGKCKCGKTQIS